MLTKDCSLNKHTIAQNLLRFLLQKEDFETASLVKRLPKSTLSSKDNPVSLQVLSPLPMQNLKAQTPATLEPQNKPHIEKPSTPLSNPAPLSIYARMVEKIKKSCPELKIKPPSEKVKEGLPEACVILLREAHLPQVYQSLAQAIDTQLGVTEIVMMDQSLMSDLLTKPYQLILIPKRLNSIPYLKDHIKPVPHPPYYRLGPSPLIFLDESTVLQNPINKRQLWQMIKTLLA